MIEVSITQRREEAVDISSFELMRADGGLLPPFSAGAHIDVQIFDGLVRQYSLCNPPHERNRYVIGVLRDAHSRGGSSLIHDTFDVGRFVRISEPRNLFPLARTAGRSILFAGGIGVTPLLSMAEQLAELDLSFELHYCTRSLARTAFVERIRSSRFAHRVHHHFDDGPADQLLRAQNLLGTVTADTDLYICGPNGFMSHVLVSARHAGWPQERVHREYFATAGDPTSANGSFEVQLAKSGRIIPVPADSSIVKALAANGIEVPVSCEAGVCGTCLTRVLEGEPDHRDSFLSDEERARNDQMALCCSRAKTARLTLDL